MTDEITLLPGSHLMESMRAVGFDLETALTQIFSVSEDPQELVDEDTEQQASKKYPALFRELGEEATDSIPETGFYNFSPTLSS